MVDDYKSVKEAFVSGTTGSTYLHIHAISAVAIASIALHSALQTRRLNLNFLSSWLVLVLPLLFSMTTFANSPILLTVLLCLPTAFVVLVMPRREHGTPLPSNSFSSKSPPGSPHSTSPPNQIYPLPPLTTFRAHMMLMTILAILAVDFPVFPRALAKCETFGVSLMDLGVGSFVFSQGVVSAIPLLKDPGHLAAPVIPKIFIVVRKTLPIIVLGLVRVLLVKATDYPEHVTEYGVHWNFFLTLALLPVLQVMLHPLILRYSVSTLGIVVGIVHQLLLSYAHLQEYILYAPRSTWFSANKEGIISLIGYLSIHLLGLSIGTLTLPPTPSWFRRSTKHFLSQSGRSATTTNAPPKLLPLYSPRDNAKTAIELCSYSILWSTLTLLTGLVKIGVGVGNGNEPQGHGLGMGVSRRMVNLSYIFWVAAFNTTFILAYVALDMLFYPQKEQKKKKEKNLAEITLRLEENSTSLIPLLDAINKNGLALFLLANLSTGLVNLSIRTVETTNVRAMVILGGYVYGLCLAAWVSRKYRLLRL
ncbi:hypothetical protein AMATHDRAFT_191841 [Amanita thiersii Skay4041]|uniref:GPI-anchored wall transfer protein n=1 Tax=Amanita thiersii Skay4041 TaxID=703135 RepID=A0A2A9NJI1_9AGAR|nr:hypothetical protein AMATHDRAFT_191841 [Amanita thiersii Skay4041]